MLPRELPNFSPGIEPLYRCFSLKLISHSPELSVTYVCCYYKKYMDIDFCPWAYIFEPISLSIKWAVIALWDVIKEHISWAEDRMISIQNRTSLFTSEWSTLKSLLIDSIAEPSVINYFSNSLMSACIMPSLTIFIIQQYSGWIDSICHWNVFSFNHLIRHISVKISQ